jgi:hypothetical protein
VILRGNSVEEWVHRVSGQLDPEVEDRHLRGRRSQGPGAAALDDGFEELLDYPKVRHADA